MEFSLFHTYNSRLKQAIFVENGATLLEVVITLAATLIFIGGLLTLLTIGINNVSQGKERTVASIYATSLLEEMKARPELCMEAVGRGEVSTDNLSFIQSPPIGFRAEIDFKSLEGTSSLYLVNVKVSTTGGKIPWEICLVGIVPVP